VTWNVTWAWQETTAGWIQLQPNPDTEYGTEPLLLLLNCYSLSPVAVSARLAPKHASYRGPELVWATDRLMSPDRGFGTSCLLHCGHLTVSQFRRQLKTFLFVKD